jgi:hypothetical protein
MHEPPRLELAVALGATLAWPDDRRGRVRHDPRVHRQVEPRRGPLIAEEIGVEVGLARVGEVIGQQHLGDAIEVLEGRRPDHVAVGQRAHPRSLRVAVEASVAHDASMETETRPPGPDLSRLAALRAFRNDPIALLERLATYGDVVRRRRPGFGRVPAEPSRPRPRRARYRAPVLPQGTDDPGAKMLLGESLLTSEDETHLRRGG